MKSNFKFWLLPVTLAGCLTLGVVTQNLLSNSDGPGAGGGYIARNDDGPGAGGGYIARINGGPSVGGGY